MVRVGLSCVCIFLSCIEVKIVLDIAYFAKATMQTQLDYLSLQLKKLSDKKFYLVVKKTMFVNRFYQ